MTKHSGTWFFRFSKRNGGDLASLSDEIRNHVLDLWAYGFSITEIATMTELHPNTIRKVARQAREEADPRGFARMKPQIMGSCDSVLELRSYAWFVKGLAERLDIHYMQAEALINDVVEDVKAKASK